MGYPERGAAMATVGVTLPAISGNKTVTAPGSAPRSTPRGVWGTREAVFDGEASKRVMSVENGETDVVPLSAQGLWTRKGHLRPTAMPSMEDLSRALGSVDHTLSEVLVLLYEVVQTHQMLFELSRRNAGLPKAPRVAPAGPALSAGDSLMEADTMVKKETTELPQAGTVASIRPMPTTEDLARSIQALDTTLSEVLVLLYHVVQANHSLVEELRDQRTAASPRLTPFKPVLYAVNERSTTGQ